MQFHVCRDKTFTQTISKREAQILRSLKIPQFNYKHSFGTQSEGSKETIFVSIPIGSKYFLLTEERTELGKYFFVLIKYVRNYQHQQYHQQNNQSIYYIAEISKDLFEKTQQSVYFGTWLRNNNNNNNNNNDEMDKQYFVVENVLQSFNLKTFRSEFTSPWSWIKRMNTVGLFVKTVYIFSSSTKELIERATYIALPVVNESLNKAMNYKYLYPVYHLQVFSTNLVQCKEVFCINFPKQTQKIPFKTNSSTQNIENPIIKPMVEEIKTKSKNEDLINHTKGQTKKEVYKLFRVQADCQTEIYHLFENSESKKYVGIAHVPDFKTSHLMNTLFRKMKQYDKHIDVLEESDEDEDEEDVSQEVLKKKYKTKKEEKQAFPQMGGYLEHELIQERIMKCKYDNVFHKWIPVSLHN